MLENIVRMNDGKTGRICYNGNRKRKSGSSLILPYHTCLVKKKMTEQPARQFTIPRITRHLARWRNTDRAYAHNREGWGYLQQGQYPRALTYFNAALSLAPDYEKALIGRGRAYFAIQYYEQARADFAHARRGNQRSHEAHFWLGQALFVLKDYQEALIAYNQTIHLKPKDAAAYNGRGEVSFHLQEYRTALANFDRALKLAPKFALAYTNRGLTYCELKQYKKAQRDFRLAISLDPAQRRAYIGSGQAAFALRDYTGARNFYQQALLIVPTCQVYNNLGMAFDALGERAQAIEAYNRAIELDPGQWVPYNNRGWSCYATQNTAAALANFEQAITLSPLEACEAYLNRAWILAERGRYGLALEECNHVLLWGIKTSD